MWPGRAWLVYLVNECNQVRGTEVAGVTGIIYDFNHLIGW